jgi:hypothetical protein
MALALSTLDLVVSAAFTLVVAAQWAVRRRPHQLLWSTALLVWTVAVAAETVAARQGAWSPVTYRLYYACGALMVAAWLGAGSLHLTAPARLARIYLLITGALSLAGLAGVFSYPVDPSMLNRTDTLGFVDVKVFPMIPVRLFVILANLLGTLAFVGSALYSLWQLRARGISGARAVGIGLIAVGGLIAASAHSLGVLGGPGLFRISELAAVAVIFSGYIVSSRRMPGAAPSTATT